MPNNSILRLLELIKIYNDQGVLDDEFNHFAAQEEENIETIDELVYVMEEEISYWDE